MLERFFRRLAGPAAPRSVADNETFVRLMQIARDDAEVRDHLLRILRLDPTSRRGALNQYIQSMQLHGAPADFVEAFTYLKDDAVAETARALLESGG
ncbi:MAG: hypothetical protein HY561_02775 [Gemmatimonadetes bacterium]|nr:hypothetical protein [Gemmatimonadota bacterium]